MVLFRGNNRGYFFIVDAFIAGVLIFLAGIVLLTSVAESPPTTHVYVALDSFMEYISKTQVRDISNSVIEDMIFYGNITHPSLTVVEQVAEFYDRSATQGCIDCLQLAKSLVDSVAITSLPPQYGYEYIVNGTAVSIQSQPSLHTTPVVASQTFITYFTTNLTRTIGPYATEVRLWIK